MKSEIIETIQAAIEADKVKQDFFVGYDKIDDLEWELPKGWDVLEYVRKRPSTEGHDDLRALDVIFDTQRPKWEVSPRDAEDRDNAEKIERWIEWCMYKANQIGDETPNHKALHSAGKYMRAIAQVDYLPYWLPKDKKKWSKEQKAAMLSGPFCVEIKDPKNIFYTRGKYGLKNVASVSLMWGQEIIDHWSAYAGTTKEGKKIEAALAKIEKEIAEEDAQYIHVDFTSYDERSVAAFKGSSLSDFSDFDSEAKHIKIMDNENPLPFINWAIVSGDGTPLLHSMLVGGSWENQCLIDTIVDSTTLREAFSPSLVYETMSGEKDLDVEYTGENNVAKIKTGERLTPFIKSALDPAMQALSMKNEGKMAQSAGIKKLQGMDMASNIQFSTMNAYIQLQMTALEPYKRVVEKLWSQVAMIMLQWVKFTEGTVTAKRMKVKSDGQYMGQDVALGFGDFDIEDIEIKVEILANTPTDKAQLVNQFISMKQADIHMPSSEILERLSYSNTEVLNEGYLKEKIENIALENLAEKLKAKTQMEIQAMAMAQQEEAKARAQAQQTEDQMALNEQQAALGAKATQQEAMMGGEGEMMGGEGEMMGGGMMEGGGGMSPPPTGDPIIPGGMMNDTNQGGQSPMVSAPGFTRNQVRGGQ